MKQVFYFYLNQMAWLKIYMPVVDELLREGKQCIFLLEPSGKYSCCFKKENSNKLLSIIQPLGVKYIDNNFEKIKFNPKDILFCVEGNVGSSRVKKVSNNIDTIVLTNCSDFRFRYDEYVKRSNVKKIIFGSMNIAKYYNKLSEKNCYLGLPKFDFFDSKDSVYKKYDLDKFEKYCLLVAPRKQHVSNFPWEKCVKTLREKGYKVIVKSRGKDSYRSMFPNKKLSQFGDYYFEDYFWFTHDTTDLLSISDLMINTGSLAIEEAIFTNTPTINYELKDHLNLSLLYDYNFATSIKINQAYDLSKMIDDILRSDIVYEFKKCKTENFNNIGCASTHIVENILHMNSEIK